MKGGSLLTKSPSARIWPVPVIDLDIVLITGVLSTVRMKVSILFFVSATKEISVEYHWITSCPSAVANSAVRIIVTIFLLDWLLNAGDQLVSHVVFHECVVLYM